MDNDTILSRLQDLFPSDGKGDVYYVACAKKILNANEKCDRNKVGQKLDAIIGALCHKLTKATPQSVSAMVEEFLSIILDLQKKVMTLPLLYEGGVGTYLGSPPLQFLLEEHELRQLLETASLLAKPQ